MWSERLKLTPKRCSPACLLYNSAALNVLVVCNGNWCDANAVKYTDVAPYTQTHINTLYICSIALTLT